MLDESRKTWKTKQKQRRIYSKEKEDSKEGSQPHLKFKAVRGCLKKPRCRKIRAKFKSDTIRVLKEWAAYLESRSREEREVKKEECSLTS